jgi:hypothetical protein
VNNSISKTISSKFCNYDTAELNASTSEEQKTKINVMSPMQH